MRMRGTLGTLWFFLLLSALFVGVGWIVGTAFMGDWVTGSVVFLAIALAMNLFVLFAGEKMIVRLYRGKYVERKDAPRLWDVTQKVALRAGMPMPKVALIPSQTPNAFATGRSPNHATVAATEGILNLLDDEELEGVMSHELSHVANRDTVVMTLAATVAGAISFAARMFFWGSLFGGGRRDGGNMLVALIVLITAPLAAMLIQLAVSRRREYLADERGAHVSGKPWALARALEKLETGNLRRPMQHGNPAHSALFIANPFRGGFASLFSTHPPMKERVRRLREMNV